MTEYAWQTVGWLAQGFFAGRMIVQWWASERCGKSVVPNAFWYLSLVGGTMLLAYTIRKGDPIIIVGSASGLLVYLRNVALLHKHCAAVQAPQAAESAVVLALTSSGSHEHRNCAA